jgi:hypothetical protein
MSIQVMRFSSFASDLRSPFPTDRGDSVKVSSRRSLASKTRLY